MLFDVRNVTICVYTPHTSEGVRPVSAYCFSPRKKRFFKVYSRHRMQRRAHLLLKNQAIHICDEYYKKQGNLQCITPVDLIQTLMFFDDCNSVFVRQEE